MNLGGPSFRDIFDKVVTLIAKLDCFERHRATRFQLNIFGYVATLSSTSFFLSRFQFCFCLMENDDYGFKLNVFADTDFNERVVLNWITKSPTTVILHSIISNFFLEVYVKQIDKVMFSKIP